MRRKQKLILGLWLALVAAALAGVLLTRPTAARKSDRYSASRAAWMRRRNLVDQKPLETARSLVAMAWTRDEYPYARRALSLADDAVDLAFATALRDAAAHPPAQTDEVRKALAHLKETEARVHSDPRSWCRPARTRIAC